MAFDGNGPVIVQAPPLPNSRWRHPWEQPHNELPLLVDDTCGPFETQLEVSYEEEEEKDVGEIRETDASQLIENHLRDCGLDNAILEGDEMEEIKLDDVHSLLEHFAKNTYRAKSATAADDDILTKCHALFSRDYHCFVITNFSGELSSHYPSKIIVLEYEKSQYNSQRETEADSLYQSLYGPAKLQDVCQRARLARCRARFPVPVILLDGKNVCRSATLSGGPEIYGRSSYDFFFAGKSGNARDEELDDEEAGIPYPQTSSDWQLFDRVRSQDIKLLKLLNVSHICDLMVEKKKVKFGMNITSSEKVDKEKRYSDFSILSLPYPGCEFFQEYSLNEYSAVGLVYAWNQAFIDARLVIPNDSLTARLDIDWNSYKTWDVIKLTQNYIRLLLKYIKNATGGLLVHCISGWDRTPLFVSLLRMSLWADGEIHKSLNALEMLYLTLGYDWFLFGHNLADKLGKREEILFFCFDFLKNIEGDEYALRKKKSTAAVKETCTKKPDQESVPDDILFDSGNVRGSNTSLNSSCSSVSNRSQDCPPTFFTTWYDSSDESVPSALNPTVIDNVTSRLCKTVLDEEALTVKSSSVTPPVAVPASHSARRSDSSSSFGCGSWQIISGTGSLRGSTSTRDSLSSQTPSSGQSSNSRHGHNSFAWGDTVEGDCFSQPRSVLTRAQKLYEVRKAFYQVYASAAGFRFRSGSDAAAATGGLSSLLDHFAEKVGIRTGRGSSR